METGEDVPIKSINSSGFSMVSPYRKRWKPWRPWRVLIVEAQAGDDFKSVPGLRVMYATSVTGDDILDRSEWSVSFSAVYVVD